jgi:glycosyltransferase involved in cell wall biosynthesis
MVNGDPRAQIHGHLSRSELDDILDQTDLVIMPSLFLETFGLVALECLSRGVPVCGIAQGGLRDFIHPSLSLDPGHPVDSFFSLLDL